MSRQQGGLASGACVLPGGESGILGSPFYANLLGRWLTNDSHPMRQKVGEFRSEAAERIRFVPDE